MYGLLCESLHDFIKESYGDDVWKLVRERADVRLHSFVTHQVPQHLPPCLHLLWYGDIFSLSVRELYACACVLAGVQRECDPQNCEGSQWSDRNALQ